MLGVEASGGSAGYDGEQVSAETPGLTVVKSPTTSRQGVKLRLSFSENNFTISSSTWIQFYY